MDDMLNVAVVVFGLGPSLGALLLYFMACRRAKREEQALFSLAEHPLTETLVVILPARNEGQGIARTLRHLLQEDASSLSVYVFDDDSDDNTAQVVRDLALKDTRLHLLQPDDVPPSAFEGIADSHDATPRFGKPWALHRALHTVWQRRQTRKECILFLDADVVLSRAALGSALAELRHQKLDALSGNPHLAVETIVEELFVPAFVSLVASQYLPSKVNDAHDDTTFLNGQFILVRGEVLDAVNGWSQLLYTVLEDVAFAKLLRKKGKCVGLADLRKKASTRMYTSLRGIRQGFGKNAVDLYGGPVRTMLLALFGLLLSFAPWSGAVFSGCIAYVFRTDVNIAIAAATTLSLLLVLMLQGSIRHRMGHARWTVLFLPLVYCGVCFVLCEASLKRWLGGSVIWKGRRYRA